MGNVIEVDDESFEAEVIRSERPVLVDFGATWCGPCRALEPIVEQIAAEHLATLKVVKIDIDEAPNTVKRYGIRGAPTLLVFRGGEKKAQHVGMTSKERLLAFVSGS
jgi:thioredoxin 1